ncbi:MAG: hypothetical protein ACRCZO_17470 [Cetobacterium sp.]
MKAMILVHKHHFEEGQMNTFALRAMEILKDAQEGKPIREKERVQPQGLRPGQCWACSRQTDIPDFHGPGKNMPMVIRQNPLKDEAAELIPKKGLGPYDKRDLELKTCSME